MACSPAITAVLESATDATINALLDDAEAVFWIDWRQDDDSIPESCESVLRTGALSGELLSADTDRGYEVYVRYRDRRLKVPLTYSGADRHITLCTLNQALAPDYEIRLCVDSHGSDTLAFLPLAASEWSALEQRFGDRVGKRFLKLTSRPNVFTDPLLA